ncbi:class A beta-lactamase-related serine hydrolase [Solwaraspora sp. WMMD1047]|uniref:serine hydrolase n=1 Tax=Solwaraspora sp. WMMD1047 TaxID=3016102 RepID=UPI002415AD2E|nr:serine hydrolase [Solwaraspora sp. WMMD1047]MDG4831950.1 class A beta-lactamase-related serine hydrolase [Solwaraspora sp. WMMD1047]
MGPQIEPAPGWAELDAELAAVDGTVSAYVGRPGTPPAYTRSPDRTHYAASTMKVAVLAALHRAAETGTLDLAAAVPVVNEFDSAAPGAARFGCEREFDGDEAVWLRLGDTAPLDWLADRMITRSSNLATNLVLAEVGLPAVGRAWAAAGARHSGTARGIDDSAARRSGLENLVTAADLAGLFAAIATHRVAGAASCAAMLDILTRQQRREDLAAGLPPGTRIAHKNGWVRWVRHGAGLVLPEDAPPYTIAVCVSRRPPGAGPTGPPEDPARERVAARQWDAAARALIARVSATAWQARRSLTVATPDQPPPPTPTG